MDIQLAAGALYVVSVFLFEESFLMTLEMTRSQ